MLSKQNEISHNSSEYVRSLADFGIPVLDFNSPEPSMTIVSDFGNGTVSQNA
jgi:hypothetical protein